jgi:hypothetical protein
MTIVLIAIGLLLVAGALYTMATAGPALSPARLSIFLGLVVGGCSAAAAGYLLAARRQSALDEAAALR